MQAVIFDMDGLLLSTEYLWGGVMLDVAQKYGIGMTADKFKETTGLRIDEVTLYWSQNFTWPQGLDYKRVADEILDNIIDASIKHAYVLPGIMDALQLLKNTGLKIGLASSSPMRMVNALIDHFDLRSFFDAVYGGDLVEYGKPHPAVFLACAKALKVPAHQCLVLEDSINGMVAALAARMRVVVVPDANHRHKLGFDLAYAQLDTMKSFHLALLN